MPDAAETSAQAKAAGNAAFQAGDFDKAIEHFTAAIEADPTNHVLYSNRSGAQASKTEFTAALLDANKCIDLKPDWAKGHSRRGAAYVGLRNWPSAQAAYEKGLELDPNSAVMKAELEGIKARRSGYTNQSQGAGALSASALFFGFFYMLPVFPARALQAYALSVGSILLLFVSNLWLAFPKKMATLQDPAFHARQEAQAFMVTLLMILTPPMPFALMPFLSIALLNVCAALKGHTDKMPGFIGSRIAWFAGEEGTMHAQSFGAVSEVIVTMMSPVPCAPTFRLGEGLA